MCSTKSYISQAPLQIRMVSDMLAEFTKVEDGGSSLKGAYLADKHPIALSAFPPPSCPECDVMAGALASPLWPWGNLEDSYDILG